MGEDLAQDTIHLLEKKDLHIGGQLYLLPHRDATAIDHHLEGHVEEDVLKRVQIGLGRRAGQRNAQTVAGCSQDDGGSVLEFDKCIIHITTGGRSVLAAFWDGSDEVFVAIVYTVWLAPESKEPMEVVSQQDQGSRRLGEEHCETGVERDCADD